MLHFSSALDFGYIELNKLQNSSDLFDFELVSDSALIALHSYVISDEGVCTMKTLQS